ncbi:MAG: acyl-CoA synthetase (NDP forming) [Paracoccaceae bacterium]|jgi:acyl-CoA synthetase (NDP forming)
MKAPLSRLFDPKSIAIVGASTAPEKPGYQMVRAFEKFPGRIYPVNPRGGNVLGFDIYKSLSDIPEPVDLIAMVVPPQASADVLREAAACGVGAAFMVSGGFSETGGDGHKRQAEILKICHDGGIRLLGPNTSGFMRPSKKLFCTFLPAAAGLKSGNIGIVAQSGGINITMAFMANELRLGISLSVGIGNGADVSVADAITYLAEDAATDVIAVHLEGVSDGRVLFDTIRRTVAHKPVVVLPVGKADLGGFAESHTGNLMGAYELTCAGLRQAGAVVVDTTTALIDAAHAFSNSRLSPSAAPGVGILTGQAGPGLLMTDKLRTAGIDVPEIGAKTVSKIAGLLPPLTYLKNPVDTGRPLETFGEVCSALAQDPVVDALLIYALHESDSVDFADAAGSAADLSGKPCVYGTQGMHKDIGPLMKALEKRGVTAIASPDRAAVATQALVEDARAQFRITNTSPGALEADPSATALPRSLDEASAKDFIGEWGIDTPQRLVCSTHAEARGAKRKIPGAAVVKILDPRITHKTETGGVHLGIRTAKQLNAALEQIDSIKSRTRKKRYLIEAMAPSGLEVIVGARNDPSWGPVVLLGLGGTTAEVLEDVSMRLAPVSKADALAMIDELKSAALFNGFRGTPETDKEALADAIVTVGRIVLETPGVREIDLNPVRVYGKGEGILALDALIVA